MTKFVITLFVFLNTLFVYANSEKLAKTTEKYNKAKTISYKATAFYPNPETDEITTFSTYYTIYNPRDKKYDFYSKSENQEEVYKNDVYTKINHLEKTYYRYENKLNQTEEMQFFRLSQFGPISLLKHNWNFVNDTIFAGKNLSHYSFVESENEYEGKKIKVEYNIYISDNYSISQFERKSFVDNILGQTVTYKFDDYTFSNKKSKLSYSLPKNYSLKYFERIENLQPLTENTKIPIFEAIDIKGNTISSENLISKTLILFSSTSCGYSKMVSDFINDANFKLNDDIKLINFFGSDSKENAVRISKKYAQIFPIIANRRDIEKEYGISGYPVLYLVNEKGIITETVDGADNILPFLNKLNANQNKK